MSRFHRVLLAASLGVSLGTVAIVEPAFAAPQTVNAPSATTYTIKAGDYLSGIAAKLGVKLSALLDANKLTVNSLILPGQQLVVPTGGSLPPAASPAAPTVYVVVWGDSLSGISSKLGVKMSALLATNKLNVTSLIYPGMKLTVPAGGAVPTATTTPTSPPTSPPVAAPTAPQAYVVVSGDYLSGIATKLGVKLSALLSDNKLTVTSFIYPGMRLTVPAGGSLPSAPPVPGVESPVSTKVAKVLQFAKAQLGKGYKFNTSGPDTFDCSGLTMAAYAEIGISIPHYSGAQAYYGTAIDWKQQAIQPGDLVFLASSSTGVIDHVGIAISATQYIHAPRSGDVVRVGTFPLSRVAAVRRLVPG